MGGILNKLGIIPIAAITVMANLMSMIVHNDVVFWITFFTLVISAYLAARKFIISLKTDFIALYVRVKRWRNENSNPDKE